MYNDDRMKQLLVDVAVRGNCVLCGKPLSDDDGVFLCMKCMKADLEWRMKNCCCFSNTDLEEGDGEDD